MKVSLSRMRSGKIKFFAFPKTHAGSYLFIKNGIIYCQIRDLLTIEDMEKFSRKLIEKEVLLFDKLNSKYVFNSRHPLILIERFKNLFQASF
jgi:hypothetical protein